MVNNVDLDLRDNLCASLDKFNLLKEELKRLSLKHRKKIVLRKTKRLIDLDPHDRYLPRCRALGWRLNIREDGSFSPCRRFGYSYRKDAPINKFYNSLSLRRLRKMVRSSGSISECEDCCRLSRDIVF